MFNILVDDMWDDEGEEEETDDIVNQVLDEIGIHLESELSTTTPGKVTNTTATTSTKVSFSQSFYYLHYREFQRNCKLLHRVIFKSVCHFNLKGK